MLQGMHVMYTDTLAQYRNDQPQHTQPEYQLALSPARHQPVKKRRLLSPSQQQYNGHQQSPEDNNNYKVSYIET